MPIPGLHDRFVRAMGWARPGQRLGVPSLARASLTSDRGARRMRLGPGSEILGRYRIERLLGSGGMGVVWGARHLVLDEQVALKVIAEPDRDRAPSQPGIPDDGVGLRHARERLVREVRAAVKLRGEHVVRVLDAGFLEDGSPFAALELIEGRNLADELDSVGALSVPFAVDLVLQACEALAEAHALGIVHRDIKPSNLLLTSRPDGSPLLKVADFGLARVDDDLSRLTGSRATMGSPPYMSPEQIRSTRDVDARTDVWSLGIVLYELCTKAIPWKGYTASGVLASIIGDAPTPVRDHLPEASDALVYALDRALDKDAERRLSTVAELAFLLAPLVVHGDERARTIAKIEHETRSRRALEADLGATLSTSTCATPPAGAESVLAASTTAFSRSLDAWRQETLGADQEALSPRRARRRWVVGALSVVVLGSALLLASQRQTPARPLMAPATSAVVGVATSSQPEPSPAPSSRHVEGNGDRNDSGSNPSATSTAPSASVSPPSASTTASRIPRGGASSSPGITPTPARGVPDAAPFAPKNTTPAAIPDPLDALGPRK